MGSESGGAAGVGRRQDGGDDAPMVGKYDAASTTRCGLKVASRHQGLRARAQTTKVACQNSVLLDSDYKRGAKQQRLNRRVWLHHAPRSTDDIDGGWISPAGSQGGKQKAFHSGMLGPRHARAQPPQNGTVFKSAIRLYNEHIYSCIAADRFADFVMNIHNKSVRFSLSFFSC